MYYVEATANFNKPKKVIEDAIKKPGCLEDFHPFCKYQIKHYHGQATTLKTN